MTINEDQREIILERVFNAPRSLVYRAYTEPELIAQWWSGDHGATVVEKSDVRPGGAWRYVQHAPDGSQYGFQGEYREIVPHEKLEYTFEFDGMPGHVLVETVRFIEQAPNQTLVTSTSVYETLEDLHGMLQTGMEEGSASGYNRLDALLVELQQ
jgi:uncharacterized protein YndB with AHSA1/START domain